MKKTYNYNEIEFPSIEELDFYYWCEEALANNIISKFVHQPEPFLITPKITETIEVKLKTKKIKKERTLLHPWEYTPDYLIDSKIGLIEGLGAPCYFYTYYIDTKGFNGTHDSKALFSLKQKAFFWSHNIYVNKVVPKVFFKKTWVPEKSRWTPTGKQRKHFYEMKTFQESKYARLQENT